MEVFDDTKSIRHYDLFWLELIKEYKYYTGKYFHIFVCQDYVNRSMFCNWTLKFKLPPVINCADFSHMSVYVYAILAAAVLWRSILLMPLMFSSWRGSQNLTLLNVRTVHKRNLKTVKVHIKKTPRKKVDNQKKAIKIPWSSLQNQLFSTIENCLPHRKWKKT